MKRTHFIFIVALFAALCFSKLNAQTVYITESGKKYHAKNCNIVKTGKKGIDLPEAKKQGYEPCKACKSDEVNSEAGKPKEEKKDKPKKAAK